MNASARNGRIKLYFQQSTESVFCLSHILLEAMISKRTKRKTSPAVNFLSTLVCCNELFVLFRPDRPICLGVVLRVVGVQ